MKLEKEEVAIWGSGEVGQATGKGFIRKGYNVVFFDINRRILKKLKDEGFDSAHTSKLNKRSPDLFFITIQVPTKRKGPQVEKIKEVAKDIGLYLKRTDKYVLVVVRSTVPPLTTKNLVTPLLEKISKKKAGKDFGVCSNPEYMRERFGEEDFLNPKVIIIGSEDEKAAKKLALFYKDFPAKIRYFKTAEAEMHKYVHNLYNACKISFFNEQREICEEMNLDADKIFKAVSESAEAFWNPEYGTRKMGPFSGSCLPKDTKGFSRWVKYYFKKNLFLIDSVIKVNNRLDYEKETKNSIDS